MSQIKIEFQEFPQNITAGVRADAFSLSHITESHWNEWVIDSVVDPVLTFLNVVSLSGMTPYERLLYGLPDSERRNDGRVRNLY